MAKMKKSPLSKTLFIVVEDEGTQDEFLSAHEKAADAAEQGVVKHGAVYELKEFITVEGVAKVCGSGSCG